MGLNADSQVDAPRAAFSMIDAGTSQTCGVRSDGYIVCWGRHDILNGMPD